jgi:hypothetical protein
MTLLVSTISSLMQSLNSSLKEKILFIEASLDFIIFKILISIYFRISQKNLIWFLAAYSTGSNDHFVVVVILLLLPRLVQFDGRPPAKLLKDFSVLFSSIKPMTRHAITSPASLTDPTPLKGASGALHMHTTTVTFSRSPTFWTRLGQHFDDQDGAVLFLPTSSGDKFLTKITKDS